MTVQAEVAENRVISRKVNLIGIACSYLRPFGLLFGFILVLSVLWLTLAVIYFSLPYIRDGADVVFSAKATWVAEMPLFHPGDEQRVLIFGSSKILSGFVPDAVDETVNTTESNHTASYNLGFPDSTTYVEHLEHLLARGEIPTHVLLTYTWDSARSAPPTTPFQFLSNDADIMGTLFPFRSLPRDAILFALRAPGHDGFRQYYDFGEQSVNQMRVDRGYYFIEGQSHYPNDQLPDDYRLPQDEPDVEATRAVTTDGPDFEKLREMAQRYGIRFI